MLRRINAIEFNKRFYKNESCYQYLIEIKLKDDIVVLNVAIRKVEENKPIFIADVRNVALIKLLDQIPFFI